MNKPQLIDAIRTRRSIRIYHRDRDVSAEQLEPILEAGLRAPSSMNKHTTQFLIIRDRAKLEALSHLREKGCAFLADVPVAIAVLASPQECRHWIADASLAAGYMQLQAWQQDLGTCWAEVDGRFTADGEDSSIYVRRILALPEDLEIVCILGVGYVNGDAPERPRESLKWDKVHSETLDIPYELLH